jgi:signal peptidase II
VAQAATGPHADSRADVTSARPLAVALIAATVLVVVALDQITKHLAVERLDGEPPVRLLGGLLYLDLTRNSGAAFSIGTNFTVIFPIIAMVVLGGIVWFARRVRSLPWAVGLGLVMGGASGNLVDRIFRAPGPLRGEVVDFISVFAEGGRVFPIFNIADSSLFCGVVLILLLEFTGRGRDGTRVRRASAGRQPEGEPG